MENDRFAHAREGGKSVFDQLIAQGVNPGEAAIIGLEIAALGLENEGTPATRNAKLGCVRVFIHRLLDGVIVNPRTHPEENCDTCSMLKDLV